MRSDKHERTHAAIIRRAIRFACKEGMERLSFSVLADRLGMSKSGVYAHFGSLSALQLEVVDAYCQWFARQTFGAVLAVPPGLPRLRAIFANWCGHIAAGTWLEVQPFCGAGEPAQLAVLASQQWLKALCAWRNRLAACVSDAMAARQLAACTDPTQLADDIYGLTVVLHHEVRFFNNADALRCTMARFRLMLSAAGACAERRHAPDHQDAIAPSRVELL
ncbi:TetR/AcrR family transcriptional regulator [Duganella sp. LX20W]|uniref:TetR/AcrR family transcriptional regulator n=1 Tax=Rugamonas brunnea TaxID=2758569 RepID=A0A7W2IDL0_9BURK|nr:TetR/AcrR family transcriptional regulator [Rugamonas brunnea]MBA5639375.1 TetR/AcrR family transcriptional regulator [Rugamonas brunnea]